MYICVVCALLYVKYHKYRWAWHIPHIIDVLLVLLLWSVEALVCVCVCVRACVRACVRVEHIAVVECMSYDSCLCTVHSLKAAIFDLASSSPHLLLLYRVQNLPPSSPLLGEQNNFKP